jgi:hypothetical protein
MYPSSGRLLFDEHPLQLWESLGAVQLSSLEHGAKLRLGQLPQEAQTQIFRMVYWYSALDDSSKDPTYQMPDGITDGIVGMTVWERPAIHAWSSKAPVSPVMEDLAPETIGWNLAKNPDWYASNNKFRIGVTRTYSLNFVLNPGQVPMTVELSETLFDVEAPTLDQLPEDIKDAIEKAKQVALTQPQSDDKAGIAVSRGRQVIPPAL